MSPTATHPDAVAAIEAFAGLHAVVLGDLVADEWITGECREVSRDGPVPTVVVRERSLQAGAAGNSAANVAALGAGVGVVGAVGEDAAGSALRDVLASVGAEVRGVLRRSDATTVVKRRLVADQQVMARFDEGGGPSPGDEDDRALARNLLAAASDADVLVVADYGLGTTDGPAVRAAVRAVRARGLPVVLDARDVASWAGVGVCAVTPNWTETRPLLDGATGTVPAVDRVRLVTAQSPRLLAATGADVVVATLDVDGAVVLAPGEPPRHVPVPRVENPHPAGAGDAFAAALALARATGAGWEAAVDLACAAAGVVVRRPGTAVCTAADLRAQVGSPLVAPEELVAALTRARAEGRRVAFTNGCFDLLHPGHVRVLQTAARLADVVVVALDSDAGVRRVKGPGRPVNGLADRAAVLAALGPVDHVVAFDDDAPLALLRAVRPDVYVKGADHDVAALPEARLVQLLGGTVHTVPYLPDRSTSGVIAACSQVAG
jgi:rfaE bifunctional protein kinase chain/domain/rfaE bifunctional protein nucleotidyltransferase chain/domain